MTIYEQDDCYELQEDNEQIARDEAWEEYMSTGVDPTGGELGPDFDVERGSAPITPPPNQPNGNSPFNPRTLFWILCIGFFVVAGISAIDKKQKEKARQEQAARDKEWEEYKREQQRQREAEARKHEHVKTPEEIEAEKKAIREEVQQLLRSGQGLYGKGMSPQERKANPTAVQSNLPKRGTPYGDGYWDGYDEGFDDADGHNSYGFKYDEAGSKYKGDALSKYVQGYRKGYKEGWEEGIEQLQDRYDNGDDELIEEEY